MNISKGIILLCCYFKIVAHTHSLNVKYECGDDQYLDEEVLDILHEYSAQKERQTNCHDIQEISQQLVLSSLT